MRVPHILKANQNNETVHEALWFDTETKPLLIDTETISHELWFGWACYRRRIKDREWGEEHWCRFESRVEFWNFVFSCTRDKTKLWMFCHNTSFDLPVLDVFKAMSLAGYILKVATLESPPTVLQYRKDKRTIVIVDTLNIWRMALKEVGKQIGIPKLNMPAPDASQLEWDTYGKQDVRVIMQACISWWEMLERLDMGGFAPTLAAQSMRTFRHKYMHHEIFIDTNEDALELSREAFHGGRTEANFIGKAVGAFYLLDVNSMYPFIMRDARIPTRIIGYTHRATIEDLAIWCEKYTVVSRVTLQTSTNFAALRHEGKLLFPTGRFETVLTTPEIVYALAMGFIIKVHETAVYDCEVAFADYMNDIWQRRAAAIAAGDTVLSYQLKILVNSFYGKWGQSGAVWQKVCDVESQAIEYSYEIDAETMTVIKYRQFGGIKQVKSDSFESSQSFPAIAAHVTAGARMQLFNLMQTAGNEHVYYCDTDSVLVDEIGLERLQPFINPTELGALKLEGIFDMIRIWGAKDYVFGTKQRQKGIRKDALVIGPNTYEQDRWLSFKGLLRAGISDKALTLRVRKHLRRDYNKGVIQSDGRVIPFHYF